MNAKGRVHKFGDNVVIGSLIAIVGSILHVDCYYTVAGVFSPIVSGFNENSQEISL